MRNKLLFTFELRFSDGSPIFRLIPNWVVQFWTFDADTKNFDISLSSYEDTRYQAGKQAVVPNMQRRKLLQMNSRDTAKGAAFWT